jgi:hypothetical protein
VYRDTRRFEDRIRREHGGHVKTVSGETGYDVRSLDDAIWTWLVVAFLRHRRSPTDIINIGSFSVYSNGKLLPSPLFVSRLPKDFSNEIGPIALG